MSILSRFTHRGTITLPRQIRHVTALTPLGDGQWLAVAYQRPHVWHLLRHPVGVAPAPGATFDYVRTLGPTALPEYHQRGDGREGFPLISGPAAEIHNVWADPDEPGILWVSQQKTYGFSNDTYPSVWRCDLRTSPPTVWGPWRWDLPHELTGGQILGRHTLDGWRGFLVTGFGASTFQRGSQGGSLAWCPEPDPVVDPPCDMTYGGSGAEEDETGWIEQADWPTITGARRLIHWPRVMAAPLDPTTGKDMDWTLGVSDHSHPFRVRDGRIVNDPAAPDYAWAVICGTYHNRLPYERGPYYYYTPDGRTYSAPGERGGTLLSEAGWRVDGVVQPLGHRIAAAHGHQAGTLAVIDGEPFYLSSFRVKLGVGWYGKRGEFCYPDPVTGAAHTPMYDPIFRAHADATTGGRVHPWDEIGISSRGYQWGWTETSVAAYALDCALQHTDPALRPREWELTHDVWPGYVTMGSQTGLLSPYTPTGEVVTKYFTVNAETMAWATHEAWHYVVAGGNGTSAYPDVVNVLEVR